MEEIRDGFTILRDPGKGDNGAPETLWVTVRIRDGGLRDDFKMQNIVQNLHLILRSVFLISFFNPCPNAYLLWADCSRDDRPCGGGGFIYFYGLGQRRGDD